MRTKRIPPYPSSEGVPYGLCANREEHRPHPVFTGSLAPYWCTADQSERLPFAAERRLQRRSTS